MKFAYSGLTALIIIFVGAALFYILNMSSVHSPPTASPKPVAASSRAPSQPGKYIDYTSGIIASTAGTKVLFFHAPWCPQCRALEKDIQSTNLPSNLTIIKVDYDTQTALRAKYGVTLQTTLVKISNEGELIKKFVAYNEPSFQSLKHNLLD